jgi:L-fuconolactonase
MIIDSHSHAWMDWPYEPPVPDANSRGRVEQLLHEMDLNGVDQAVLVAAQIEHNPQNNSYVADMVQRYSGRLHHFADVDSSWSATYHQPGAAARLSEAADRWPLHGFTHYLHDEDDGAWLYSEAGLAFFEVAAQRKLIASIAARPHHQPAIRKVAEAFPTVPILCHHLGLVKAAEGADGASLREVLRSARHPNIMLKLSGFAYCSQTKWDYPYTDALPIVRQLYEHYGADRMCWGSDYPVVRFFMTYRQSLEAFRTHCSFVPPNDQAKILGGTLERLLAHRAVP